VFLLKELPGEKSMKLDRKAVDRVVITRLIEYNSGKYKKRGKI